MRFKLFIILLGIVILVLTACNPQTSGPTPIRIAVLPVLDTLPIHVAQEEGLFEKHTHADSRRHR